MKTMILMECPILFELKQAFLNEHYLEAERNTDDQDIPNAKTLEKITAEGIENLNTIVNERLFTYDLDSNMEIEAEDNISLMVEEVVLTALETLSDVQHIEITAASDSLLVYCNGEIL